jgi:hypothetical protein
MSALERQVIASRQIDLAERRAVGAVYFVACNMASAIKVGFTTRSVRKRLYALQTGWPVDLTLERVIEGDRRFERDCHAALYDYNMRGEWFDATATRNLLAELDTIAAERDRSVCPLEAMLVWRARYGGFPGVSYVEPPW